MKDLYIRITENIRKAVISDKSRQRLLFLFLNGVFSLISFIMTIVNWFAKEHLLLILTLLFSMLCLFHMIMVHFFKRFEKIIYIFFVCEGMALLTFFLLSGISDGVGALWICLIPSFSLWIFGMKKGSLLSIVGMILLVFLFWIPAGRNLLLYEYPETFMLKFPFLYASISLISFFIEYLYKETKKQLENAKANYEYLYQHDALTGLYNRYGIEEHIEKAFRENTDQKVAIILFDIDDFKKINDVYGHECGDEVLKMVASVPLELMCEHCHCCKWGGEEFLLFMQCEHNAAEMAEKIRKRMEKTNATYNGAKIKVTISGGVAICEKSTKITIHELIELADQAMYNSKKHGKNKVTVMHKN